MHSSYYFGAHVCVMVFDVNRKITYQNLKNWYKELRVHCPHIPVLVIANKIDLNENAVKRKYVFIDEIGCPLEFVSAADGTNVVSIFQQALEQGLHYKLNPHQDDITHDILDLLAKTKPDGSDFTETAPSVQSKKSHAAKAPIDFDDDDFNF